MEVFHRDDGPGTPPSYRGCLEVPFYFYFQVPMFHEFYNCATKWKTFRIKKIYLSFQYHRILRETSAISNNTAPTANSATTDALVRQPLYLWVLNPTKHEWATAANSAEMARKGGLRFRLSPYKKFSYAFKPRCGFRENVTTAFGTGTTMMAGIRGSPWIGHANWFVGSNPAKYGTDVEHYSPMFCVAGDMLDQETIDVRCRAVIQWCDPLEVSHT